MSTADIDQVRRRLVFVDPEDESIEYWWPALIVPAEEFELFTETMDHDAGTNVGAGECLVCYFEDGSFSTVSKHALIPFNPAHEPFLMYTQSLARFGNDAGVRRAVRMYEAGYDAIPMLFKWLRLRQHGYLDVHVGEDAEGTAAVGSNRRKGPSAAGRLNKWCLKLEKHSSHKKRSSEHSKMQPMEAVVTVSIQGAPKRRGRKKTRSSESSAIAVQ